MSEIKVLIRNDNGVLYIIGCTHQMQVHVVETDDLERVTDDAGRESLITATQQMFLHPHPAEIFRGNFDKLIEDYINDEL